MLNLDVPIYLFVLVLALEAAARLAGRRKKQTNS